MTEIIEIPTGNRGMRGVKGDKGDDGKDGKTGPRGPKGENGGTDGQPGEKGPDGNKGPVGDKGPDGNKGADGDKGPDGDKGSPGQDGFTNTFVHGSNANAIRPVSSFPVVWVGTIQPVNWVNGDMWLDTTVSSGGGTTPTMPAGLVAHWSASDLSLANGVAVTTWNDRMANLALTPTGGPTFISGDKAVSFDGVDDRMDATLAVAQPTTTIVVFRLPSTTTSQSILGSATAIHSISTTSASLLQGSSGTAISRAGALTANQYYFAAYVVSGSQGQLKIGAETLSSAAATGANGRATVRVASNTGGTAFSRVDIKAILVFSTALTNQQIEDVRTLVNTDLGTSL